MHGDFPSRSVDNPPEKIVNVSLRTKRIIFRTFYFDEASFVLCWKKMISHTTREREECVGISEKSKLTPFSSFLNLLCELVCMFPISHLYLL